MKILTDPGVLREALDRLEALRPDAERKWGKMSVGGMLCHLNDAYVGLLAMRAARSTSPPATVPWAGRYLLRPLALHVPLRWPKGVPTTPGVDQLIGGTPPQVFEEDKAKVVASMTQFAATPMDGTFHPIFGPLTQWEWMRWGWLHIDHHLRQFSS